MKNENYIACFEEYEKKYNIYANRQKKALPAVDLDEADKLEKENKSGKESREGKGTIVTAELGGVADA